MYTLIGRFGAGHVVDAVACWSGEKACVVAAGDRWVYCYVSCTLFTGCCSLPSRNGSVHILCPSLQSTVYSLVCMCMTLPDHSLISNCTLQVVESPAEACSQPVFSALHIISDAGANQSMCVDIGDMLGLLRLLQHVAHECILNFVSADS